MFTELPLERIGELEELSGADINRAKIILADEATALLHGSECLDAIHQTIESMFTKSKNASVNTYSLPRIFVSPSQLEGENGVRFVDLFLELKLATSKKDAKRLIAGGGARLGDVKITDELATLTASDFEGVTEVTLKAGKKRAGVVELK
uniref:RNA-binding S4 domain-containing protein n=1 Tax=Proboscia inermis TaxID=420281 RepID=A0A7S0CPQ2_9STRA